MRMADKILIKHTNENNLFQPKLFNFYSDGTLIKSLGALP